jgi:hypothetical protein
LIDAPPIERLGLIREIGKGEAGDWVMSFEQVLDAIPDGANLVVCEKLFPPAVLGLEVALEARIGGFPPLPGCVHVIENTEKCGLCERDCWDRCW